MGLVTSQHAWRLSPELGPSESFRLVCVTEQSEICIRFSGMTETAASLEATVLARVASETAGSVWTPRDFLDLGPCDAVDKTLQRLTRFEGLRRVGRDLYDIPSFKCLTQECNPPNPRRIVEAIARRDQIRALMDGMTATNDLGLTNASHAQVISHTDSLPRSMSLGQLRIVFRPTVTSKLYAEHVAANIEGADRHMMNSAFDQVIAADDETRLGLHATTASASAQPHHNVERDFGSAGPLMPSSTNWTTEPACHSKAANPFQRNSV